MWLTSLLPSVKWRTGTGCKLRRKHPTNRFVPRLEVLEDRTVPSTLTVLNNLDNGPDSLRDSIGHAKDGDTIVFDPSLAGQTIMLTDQLEIKNSLDIEGDRRDSSLVVISGNDTSRVFAITEGLTVTIAGLTITHGRVEAESWGGGGILNAGSTLTLANDVLSHNQAFSQAFPFNMAFNTVRGGAVSNFGGTLTVIDSTFTDNHVTATDLGIGGAIANSTHDDGRPPSSATVLHSTFVGNESLATIGEAQGGAIANYDGCTMRVENSTFTGNQAIGGNAFGFGGAISNHGNSVLTLRNSTLTNNQAIGGSNITGATSNVLGVALGGGLFNEGYVEVSNAVFDGNVAKGGSDNIRGTSLDGTPNSQQLVSAAYGGAIDTVGGWFGGTGTLMISNSTFTGNQAVGGRGSAHDSGGNAFGGAIAVRGSDKDHKGAFASVSASVFIGNQAAGGEGGTGGNGGPGLGGGIYVDDGSALPWLPDPKPATLMMLGSAITDNHANGGLKGAGGSPGAGGGGGIYIAAGGVAGADTFTLISGNHDDDVFGVLTIFPCVSISDVTQTEGQTGQTTLFTFTVTLSAALNVPVTMSFTTVDGVATVKAKDYIALSGTLIFNPGETSKTITIAVIGDAKREANEVFYVDLFGLSANALFVRSVGIGTILNDD